MIASCLQAAARQCCRLLQRVEAAPKGTRTAMVQVLRAQPATNSSALFEFRPHGRPCGFLADPKNERHRRRPRSNAKAASPNASTGSVRTGDAVDDPL